MLWPAAPLDSRRPRAPARLSRAAAGKSPLHPDSGNSPDLPRGSLPGAAAYAGLAAGGIDLLINLHHTPPGLEWPAYSLLPMLAAAVVAATALFVSAGLTLGVVGRIGVVRGGGALSLGVSVTLLLLGLQWCEATPYYYSRLMSFLFMGNLAAAAALHVLWKVQETSARRERVALLLLAALAYAAAGAHLAGTLYITRVEELWDFDTATRVERWLNVFGAGVFGLGVCTAAALVGKKAEASLWARRLGPRGLLPLPWLALAYGLFRWRATSGGEHGFPFEAEFLFLAGMGLSLLAAAVLLIRPSRLTAVLPAGLLALLVVVGALLLNRQALADLTGAGSYTAEGRDVRRIVLITSDALRSDVLESYGGNEIATPALTAFSSEAAVFDEAISAASWTLPSFAGMFSGLAPGVFDSIGVLWSMPEEVRSLSERLSGEGYYTAAIGMNPLLRPRHGLDQGFRHYDFYPRPRQPRTLGSRAIALMLPTLYQTDRSSEELKDLTVEWIERNREKDFFLWLHFWDPHTPLGPPDPYRPEGEGPLSIKEPWERSMDIKSGNYDPDPDEREWLRQLYLGEVRYVDAMFGQLMDTLKRLDLYEDALIIFSSDHGEEFWDHGGFGHGQSLFHELIQVPLFIKTPAATQATRHRQPVWTVSLMPTILDLAGVAYEEGEFSAPSLLPLMEGSPDLPATLPIYSETAPEVEARHRWGVRFEAFEYMQSQEGKAGEELYNLDRDPAQLDEMSERAPEVSGEGDALLGVYHEENQVLRDRHGLVFKEALDLPQEEMDRLRRLGYI